MNGSPPSQFNDSYEIIGVEGQDNADSPLSVSATPLSSPLTSTSSEVEIETKEPLIVWDNGILCMLEFLGLHRVPLVLDANNQYYINGPISVSAKAEFSAYTARVGEIHLVKQMEDEEEVPETLISPSALLRLAQLQKPDQAFFPSLSKLNIRGVSEVLDIIHLFLSPSLKTLEMRDVPPSKQAVVSSFLHSLGDEATDLDTLILGKGSLTRRSYESCYSFLKLTRLEFIDAFQLFPCGSDFFEDWGTRTLKIFVIHDSDGRGYDCSCYLEDLSTHEPSYGRSTLSTPQRWTEYYTCLFGSLTKLDVRGNMALIIDTLSFISSCTLEELTVDCVTFHQGWDPEIRPTRVLCSLLTNVVSRSSKMLRKVCLSFSAQERAVLPRDTFDALLHLPSVEHLEISGWTVENMAISITRLSGPIANLKVLHLPVGSTLNCGIPLNRLRPLCDACPNLRSLRFEVTQLSDVPEIPPSSHPLNTLTLSSNETPIEWKAKLRIARYLDVSFKKLTTITSCEDGKSEESKELWEHIEDLVQMCQVARLG